MEAIRCEPCGDDFSNVRLYNEHLNHEVHLRNARAKPMWRCEICDGGYSGETTFLAHIRGKRHEKRMETMSLLADRSKLDMIKGENISDLTIDTFPSKVVTTKDGPYLVCKECKAKCNTEEQLQMHQQGRKCRKKRIQKMDENDFLLECKIGHDQLRLPGDEDSGMGDENVDIHERLSIERQNSTDSNMSDTNTVSSYATAFSDFTSAARASNNLNQHNQAIDDISEYYDKGKGYCLIISEETFSEKDGGNRNGSRKDVNILKETFEYLNFKVIIEVDLTLEDTRARLQEFAYTLYTNQGDISLMCVCLLSHGDENCIKTVDGQGIRLDDVKHFFDSKNCPSMNGKPKLFIRNACRGRNVLRNINILQVDYLFGSWLLR